MGCLSSFGINQFGSFPNNDYSHRNKSPYVTDMNEYMRRDKIRRERLIAEDEKKEKDEIEAFLNKKVDPKLFVFDPNFLKDCDNIQKIKYDNSEYEGQIKDGKKHGKGITRWYSGNVYHGEYKE